MEKVYKKSLQMIKELNIKNEEEYNKIVKEYSILNIVSLKYIAGTNSFEKILKIAKTT